MTGTHGERIARASLGVGKERSGCDGMARKERQSEMKHGHRHDESPIILSSRIDDSVGYSVLRQIGA